MTAIKNLLHRSRETRRYRRMERQRIRDLRLSLPNPDTLDDAKLTEELWRALAELSEIHVAFLHTDHLSDRELYTLLRTEILQETTWPAGQPGAMHMLDLMAGGSREAVENFLRYYADKPTRAYFAETCPGLDIPKKEKLPFRRDRRLASLQAAQIGA